MKSNPNRLSLSVYDGTTELTGAGLEKAQNLRFSTVYPGGLFEQLSFTLPRETSRSWVVQAGQKIRAYNGLDCVWEGIIDDITLEVDASGRRVVEAAGAWSSYLMSRSLRKPWADNRINEAVWVWDETQNGAELIDLDRYNRLRFTPNGEACLSGRRAKLLYNAPTGETIKRVTFNYDMSEVAVVTPDIVYHNDAPAGANTFTDLANAYDGTASNAVTVTLTSDDYLYIGADEKTWFSFIRFDMGATVNGNAATLSAQYPAETAPGTVAWTALTITDGTAAAGKCLAQDGDVTFTRPGDWQRYAVNGNLYYWVRLKASANLTASIVINEMYTGRTQAWSLGLLNASASSLWGVTSSGSGSQDLTLATPTTQLQFYFQAALSQMPPDNGTVYGQVTNVVVYTETGSINLTEIAKDVRAKITELSADESLIASNTLSLVPFVSETKTYAEILTEAASYGDSSFNPWAVGVREGDLSTDGKPILFAEAQPNVSTGTPDYFISVDDSNLIIPFRADLDISKICNWVAVRYRTIQGYPAWVTPDDDAALKDTTSISAYGERHPAGGWLTLETTDLATAKNYAKRYLAARKDPQWTLTGGVRVKGYIRGANNARIPASRIRAGKLLRVENFLNDLSGPGLTFLATRTNYNDADRTCDISVGRPNALDVWLARALWDLRKV